MNPTKYNRSAVWLASDLEQHDNWNFSLDQTSREHLKQMIKATLDKDRPLFDYKPDEFDLGPAGKTIAAAMDMAHYGRGIALLSGLPRDGVSEQEFELLNWAIGLHCGVARPQGRASQYISSVRDSFPFSHFPLRGKCSIEGCPTNVKARGLCGKHGAK